MVTYFKNPEYNKIADRVLLIAGLVFLNRITDNWAMIGIAVYGISAATSRKIGKALVVFMLLSLFPMVNPMIMPRYGQFAVIARITSILMSFALIAGGSMRNGNHEMPLLSIFGYIFVAAISSAFGYNPLISYLKIINFIFFILAIYFGTRNLHLNPNDLMEIRSSMLAITLLFVYGSLATLPFPSVAYFTSLKGALMYGGSAYARQIYDSGSLQLFSGVTVHSQFLGPMIACCFGWLLCDMWIVERKLSKLHLALLAPIPVIAYMTRSRLAFLVLIVAVLGNALYCLPKINVHPKLKSTFKGLMFAGLLFMIIGGVFAEVRSSAITRWLRKNENLTEDNRTIGDAVTNSRQRLIEESMSDFKKNVFWGMGFQVAENMPNASFFSASIEKGVLPVMILGETGICGAVAFVIFLSAFFIVCQRKKYIATAVLFMVYLSTNIAEATFFSPSGSGGVEWVYMLVGGFAIDMSSVVLNTKAEDRIDSKNLKNKEFTHKTKSEDISSVPMERIRGVIR